MTIYCDESGGLNAGAMTFAAMMLSSEAAAAIHARFRAVTGLRGELKGSRISLTERAYLLELFDRAGGRAWVAVARRETLAPPSDGKLPSDLALYTALLDLAVSSWLPETGGCVDIIGADGVGRRVGVIEGAAVGAEGSAVARGEPAEDFGQRSVGVEPV